LGRAVRQNNFGQCLPFRTFIEKLETAALTPSIFVERESPKSTQRANPRDKKVPAALGDTPGLKVADQSMLNRPYVQPRNGQGSSDHPRRAVATLFSLCPLA
jgi:hypothetical protein